MSNVYVIYIHVCPNGKCYVGSTRMKPEDRWRMGEGYAYNTEFYSDIKKYGWDNIQHIIIEKVEGKNLASERERFYIKKYQATDAEFGYNKNDGGYKGYSVCEGTREKQSKRRKEYFSDESNREKKRRSQIEAMKDEERRDRIRQSVKKYYETETKEKKQRRIDRIATASMEWWKKEEAREAASKHFKELWQTEEYRAKVISKIKGRKFTDEHKEKISRARMKPVRCVETGEIFPGFQAAADFAKVTKCCISDVLRGKQATSGGYHWEYV